VWCGLDLVEEQERATVHEPLPGERFDAAKQAHGIAVREQLCRLRIALEVQLDEIEAACFREISDQIGLPYLTGAADDEWLSAPGAKARRRAR
jgi:hypothetical protein